MAELTPGMPDEAVLDQARRTGAVLVTADKDFGELVHRQQRAAGGIVLIRLAGVTAGRKAEVVATVFRERVDVLPRSFTVIMPAAVRVRGRG